MLWIDGNSSDDGGCSGIEMLRKLNKEKFTIFHSLSLSLSPFLLFTHTNASRTIHSHPNTHSIRITHDQREHTHIYTHSYASFSWHYSTFQLKEEEEKTILITISRSINKYLVTHTHSLWTYMQHNIFVEKRNKHTHKCAYKIQQFVLAPTFSRPIHTSI